MIRLSFLAFSYALDCILWLYVQCRRSTVSYVHDNTEYTPINEMPMPEITGDCLPAQ
jgi:hypothetical protein